jgi:hypothetical protein
MDDDKDNDDGHTLAEVIKGQSEKTAQESLNVPGGDLLPIHPRGPRATA